MWVWDRRFAVENKAWFNVQQRLVNTSHWLDPEGLSYEDNANAENQQKLSPVPLPNCTSVLPRLGLLYVTPPMPPAAEYWLWNPTAIKQNRLFVSGVLLHIQTQISRVWSSNHRVQPKPGHYCVGCTEKQTAEHVLFISKIGETRARLNRGKRF